MYKFFKGILQTQGLSTKNFVISFLWVMFCVKKNLEATIFNRLKTNPQQIRKRRQHQVENSEGRQNKLNRSNKKYI